MTVPPLEREARLLAARLPPLLVAAERIAATVAAGAHGRRRTGPGETFWQYRGGQPGDAAAAIDWRQSARGQRLYVRETEWAAAQTVWLWCDSSPSMAWRSQPDLADKGERAAVLGLALAALLLKAGERVGVLAPRGQGAPPRAGTDLGHIGRALLGPEADGGPGGWRTGLPGAAGLPRHGEVVLVSDFLQPLDSIEAAVRALAATGASGQMVQVLDPAEETLPFTGRVRFAGLEGEGEMLVRRAEDLRDGYGERLAVHRDGLAAIARAAGWGVTVHHTDQPPETALLALHQRLAGTRRGGRG